MSGRGAAAAPGFGAHGRLALVALTLLLASCANLPTPVMPADEYDPEIYEPAPAPSTPLVESPPVEPVEPLALAPPPQPSPAPAPSAPAASPPSSAAPTIVIAPAPATEPTDDQQMLTLLADLQRYNNLPNDELKREITSATQALARQRNDVNRIRLAVLYTLLRASPQDDQRALQLFENVAKNAPATSPVRQLAAILQAQVVERQRAVRDEQQKADAAIQKLEALRAMERSLLRDRVRSGGGGGGAGGSAGGSGR